MNRPPLRRRVLRTTLALYGAAVVGLAVAAFSDQVPYARTPLVTDLPPITLTPPAATDTAQAYVIREAFRRGETLPAFLERIGAEDEGLLDYTSLDEEVRAIQRQLRAHSTATVRLRADGRVDSLILPLVSGARVAIHRADDGFRMAPVGTENDDGTAFLELRQGVITHSLFATASEIGMPDAVASKLAEIFGTQIDFSRDLRVGDSFAVIYETKLDAEGLPQPGEIVAAEFVNQGKRHVVLRYDLPGGKSGYYTPDGRVLGTGFLRYPLRFTRVSSNFGGRFHPIKREWRHHAGTDFAAPPGTPVMAASDGVVKFAGWQNGYGNFVLVEHRSGYVTGYGHLKGFAPGLKAGKRVSQGDVIGYVGSTGWATGPHLHYEVRINGKPQDPLKIALPAPEPLPERELARFRQQTAPLLEKIALLTRTPVEVAAAD
ncbi:M23 family metallopeptidase [Tepidiphilus baoligensis]|uniref:Peptidoglycan DD-metalloendopeptidase family protein n=1 Tax=Tepidiphilus baoligensis TaxID=2698687 RepID=A0ABX1QI44_9PROT|nr:M23 family metallopeptidase [Tepidiphilus baoligensis]NMH15728.1 peptidoglycan DD-metalloendopeptidase family protein [Tepidiphilus baoligensis]